MNRIFRIWAFGDINDQRGEFSPLGESEGVSVGKVVVACLPARQVVIVIMVVGCSGCKEKRHLFPGF